MTDKQLVRVEDEAQLGPAMHALANDMQRAFVSALVTLGCTVTRAAELAGYAVAKGNGHARRLAHDPRIQAAIHEEALKLIRTDGPAALHALREIAFDKTAAHRDRLKAIDMILSRGGFHEVSEHRIEVNHKSDDQLRTELLAMAEELGMDPTAKAKLIGGPVTDAEFSEISEPPKEKGPPRKRAPKGETPEERQARHARVREERRERMRQEYEAAQAGRAGLEDLLPAVPLADEEGGESDFNLEQGGIEEEYPDYD